MPAGQWASRRACPAQPSYGAAEFGGLYLGDHDALTGLWNRLRFEQELDHARLNAERLALVSIDVDRYRDVIGRHGAAAAQGVIQAIAQVLAERLRPNDTLASMGGDEFAADTALHEAKVAGGDRAIVYQSPQDA